MKATQFVHQQLVDRARDGAAVLLISLDLDEVMALSDRIAVLAAGRLRGIVSAQTSGQLEIGGLMTAGEDG